jgi:hypothetical protein
VIGLIFLGAALLWLAFTVYLTIKVPRWLGFKNPASWLVRTLLVPVLLIGPFVDHIVGMRQFEKLCEEKTAITVSPNAGSIKQARDISSEKRILPGYWINIWAGTRTFFDIDSGEEFLSYPVYRTRGGRVAGLALMGGWHSCSAESPSNKNHAQVQSIWIYRKIINGCAQ